MNMITENTNNMELRTVETGRLLNEYAKTRSIEIRNQIVLLNHGLIEFTIAHFFNNNDPNRDEMVQDGNIGLIKAVETYSSEKGAAFAAHAVTQIRKAIQEGAQTHTNIRMPASTAYGLRTGKLSENTASAAAAALNCVSIDKPNEDGDTLYNILPDQDGDTENKVVKDALSEAFWAAVKECTNEQEYQVLVLLFHDAYARKNLREVAEEMHLTSQRVGQIRKSAYAKLKKDPRILQLYSDLLGR